MFYAWFCMDKVCSGHGFVWIRYVLGMACMDMVCSGHFVVYVGHGFAWIWYLLNMAL